MVGRLCQLKSLLTVSLLFVLGCTKLKTEGSKAPQRELPSPISAGWFEQDPNHGLWNLEGRPEPHLFFDLTPDLSKDKTYGNVVITTPYDSPYAYKMDLKSGQRYFDHAYCAQKDIWEQRGGTFNRPQFSLGHMPRMLDQLGGPQKVVVLGDYIRREKNLDRQSYRIRIVGAFVEKSCPQGNCVVKNNWVSRLVLVGVDPDESMIITKDIKKKYDWNEVKSALENIDGRNFVTEKSFPAIKIGQLMPYSEAIKYIGQNTIYFSDEELGKISNACRSLYDRLWNDLHEGDKKISFQSRLATFTEKYLKEINTCDKFIYYGNISMDHEKFWFLSQMMMFFRLHSDGHYFDCSRKSWTTNTVDDMGNLMYDLKQGIRKCDDKALNVAMDYMPNYLVGLKGNHNSYYRFIEFDTHSYGSHRKLYTWVKVDRKKFDCSNDPNEAIIKSIRVMPEDISWKIKGENEKK